MGYEKAVLIPEDGKKEIKVQFNPAEYNLSRSTTYAEKKVLGLDDPFTQYIAGEAETLKITLMFDTYMPPGEKNAEESGSDVRLQTEKIAKLMELDPKKTPAAQSNIPLWFPDIQRCDHGIEPDIYDVSGERNAGQGKTGSHIPLDGKRKHPCSVRIPGQDEMPDAL